MNPPIRDKSHYDRLWYAVKNNLNDTIGSDHAPHLKANKENDPNCEKTKIRQRNRSE